LLVAEFPEKGDVEQHGVLILADAANRAGPGKDREVTARRAKSG